MRIPYDRIVAWLAGPVSIVAGAVAVWLDNHFGLLGKAGLGSDQTAKAINDALTFAVGAGVTYLSQAKWMTNLAAWWQNLKPDQINQGSTMTEEQQEPQEEQAEEEQAEKPFVEEPGYDEPGPGVEPDQALEEETGDEVGE